MDKNKKLILKQLHNFLSENFTTCAEQILNEYLSEEDILIYIENEQTIAQRIASIKKNLEDKELNEQMKKIEQGKPIESCLDEYETKLKLLNLKYKQVCNLETNTAEEVNQKIQKINEVEEEIKRTEKALESMKVIKQETAPPKRKVGRPRKIKN